LLFFSFIYISYIHIVNDPCVYLVETIPRATYLKKINMIVKGYLLLKNDTTSKYQGIDRGLFEPLITDIEELNTSIYSGFMWEIFPDGWKKDAYKIYEENSTDFADGFGLIINDLESAIRILHIVNKNLSIHEIVYVEIFNLEDTLAVEKREGLSYLGLDIAYLGGDYYSAVKNGLFYEPDNILKRGFAQYINGNGLFSELSVAKNYLSEFRKYVESEENSKFVFYQMYGPMLS